ncbi:MAG: N-acetylmuramoyl-L-alanine amidase [Bacteroidota bacterium]
MNENFCVYLDAGHGGLSPLGRYTTGAGKQFQHKQGVFHGNGFFYEGVWNRTITSKVAERLSNLKINHIIVSHEYLDLDLAYRADKANWYHRNYKRGIIISNHANASPSHRGRGYEVYTSPGRTGADAIAEFHWNHVNDLLGKNGTITMRSDMSDGDHDKEENFYMLRKTVMPAILIEHLFFDNYRDALLLFDDDVIERFVEAQVRTIINYINSL